MQVSQDIKNRVEARLKECCIKASDEFDMSFAMPDIDYSLRGTAAGQALSRKDGSVWKIRINAVLLIENLDKMLHRTVAHEMAHLITSKVWSNKWNLQPHGKEWKRVMSVLGVEATRCHNYDVTNSSVRKSTTFSVTCVDCNKTYSLGPTRAATLQSRPTAYRCKCKTNSMTGTLKFNLIVPTLSLKVKKQGTMTKMDWCKMLYRTNPLLSRADMIKLFVGRANCTVAGASTYYATIKSGK